MVLHLGHLLFHITAVCLVLWILHTPSNTIVIVKGPKNQTVREDQDKPASFSFGRPFPKDGLWGHLAYTQPDDGCKPFVRPDNGTDWIAVMSMSDKCSFAMQVLHAQNALFVAAIVHNNKSDDLIEMTNTSQRFDIPSTFIGLSSGRMLVQFDLRLDVNIFIVEQNYSDDEELLLIILAGVSSFSAVVVLGIVVGIGIHNCCKNRAQLLSRWKLKRLPLHVFKKGDLYENCAICLEEYNEGDKLRILPCAHAFHSKCIDVWLTKNRKTCPLCNETVNPSRRKKNRTQSEQDGDDERRPLLQPVSNNGGDSEPEEHPELIRNQSNVEIHEEPLLRAMNGRRNYGAAGVSDVSMAIGPAEPDEPDEDSLFTVEYVNMFGQSPLCHIKEVEPDCATLNPASETKDLLLEQAGGENQKLIRAESDAKREEPEVFISKSVPTRDKDEIV